jgi:hypothetical protein
LGNAGSQTPVGRSAENCEVAMHGLDQDRATLMTLELLGAAFPSAE